MSTLNNITSLNLSLQTGGAALAVKAVKSVAKPERVVYVFGTADDVAPNFTTILGAELYAQSLTPTATEPVVIRMFTKANGEPYTLADYPSSPEWYEWVNFSHIIFVSDFVRLNTYYSIPETMPNGLQVWYIDPNGVETLWVGNEDGSAQLVGGALVGTFTPVYTISGGDIVTIGDFTLTKVYNLVTISGSITVSDIIDNPTGTYTIGTIPSGFRPSSKATAIYTTGNTGSDEFIPVSVGTNGIITVNKNFSIGSFSFVGISIIGSWTV
jgi:hypothetical protein